MFTIEAHTRDGKESLEAIRAGGKIPAVFYGAGKASTNINVELKAFEKILKDAGESSTVTLKVDGMTVDTLIHDVQFDPVKNVPVHVDFLVVDMNKTIDVSVPVEFVGVAPAVKQGLGTLVKVLHEVEIRALPKDLPHNLVVNLEKLETIDSNLTVGDIVLPSGVTLITKAHEIVAAIAVQKEEVETPTGPIDLSTIEVEKKGKKEEVAEAE